MGHLLASCGLEKIRHGPRLFAGSLIAVGNRDFDILQQTVVDTEREDS
jgi:hypothetical protein